MNLPENYETRLEIYRSLRARLRENGNETLLSSFFDCPIEALDRWESRDHIMHETMEFVCGMAQEFIDKVPASSKN